MQVNNIYFFVHVYFFCGIEFLLQRGQIAALPLTVAPQLLHFLSVWSCCFPVESIFSESGFCLAFSVNSAAIFFVAFSIPPLAVDAVSVIGIFIPIPPLGLEVTISLLCKDPPLVDCLKEGLFDESDESEEDAGPGLKAFLAAAEAAIAFSLKLDPGSCEVAFLAEPDALWKVSIIPFEPKDAIDKETKKPKKMKKRGIKRGKTSIKAPISIS